MQIDLDGPAPEGDDDDEDLAPELRLVPADAAARELTPSLVLLLRLCFLIFAAPSSNNPLTRLRP